MKRTPNRPWRLAAAATAASVIAFAACAPPSDDSDSNGAAVANVPESPSAPVDLRIVDGGGRVAVEGAIANFAADNPDIISSVEWESASEGDIAGLLQPQVTSGNVQVDLVITGSSGLAAGQENGLWVPLVTEHGDRIPNMANYTETAEELQALTEGDGVTVVWCYCGPTIEYNAELVTDPPENLDDLLQWASENPGMFGYSRPANSGVGRTFLLALPYMLDDEDPNDPANGWDNTWAYLEELDQYVDNYPTSTSQAMENLAAGTWTLMPSSAGRDVGPRARGQVPAEMEGYALEGTAWMMDPNYALVPRGVSDDKLSAILLLLDYVLSEEGNANAGAGGQYIPGRVVEVPEESIPAETVELLETYSRDWFEEEFNNSERYTPPPQEVVVSALDIWDRRIGAGN